MVTYLDGTAIWERNLGGCLGVVTPVFTYQENKIKIQTIIPHQCSPSMSYGLPKIHKTGTPLRPIVSSRGSITYGVAKDLAYTIKPLVGHSPHHLKNTQHFTHQLQGKRLEPGQVITSFDVKALFTSAPVAPSIDIIKQKLQQDPTLPQRTNMSI